MPFRIMRSQCKIATLIQTVTKEVVIMTESQALPSTSEKSAANDNMRPPKSILKLVGRAVAQFQMIREGDRVLLGLSGGKDSLSLLLVLKHLQKHSQLNLNWGCVPLTLKFQGLIPPRLKSGLLLRGCLIFMSRKIWWLWPMHT